MHPSGVRIGVPETTRLGMKESEMERDCKFHKTSNCREAGSKYRKKGCC